MELALKNIFINYIFLPFLAIIIILWLIIVSLNILYNIVAKKEAIEEKEESINKTFIEIKNLCKKELDLISSILLETEKQINIHYEKIFFKKAFYAVLKAEKNLEKVGTSSKKLKSIENIKEAEYIIDFLISEIVELSEKYPDIKAYSKFLEIYINIKNIRNEIEDNKNLYNRKVKEFNFFINTFKQYLFTIFFSVKQRKYI